MLSRILRCQQAGVPMTNYGLTIAYSLGIFERALEPFHLGEFHHNRSSGLKEALTPAQASRGALA